MGLDGMGWDWTGWDGVGCFFLFCFVLFWFVKNALATFVLVPFRVYPSSRGMPSPSFVPHPVLLLTHQVSWRSGPRKQNKLPSGTERPRHKSTTKQLEFGY